MITNTEKWARGTELALTLLRVVTGLVLMAHGVQKLAEPASTAQGFASLGIPMPTLAVGAAILGEFAGGLGLALGALTRVAALGPIVTMLGAIFWAHLGKGLFAQSGGFEYPLILLLVALVFAVRGGGPYSLDAWVRRTRARGLRPREPLPGRTERVPRAPRDGELGRVL